MNTSLNDLFFLNIDEAQDILNQQDPGYQIAVAKSGLAFIVDESLNVVCKMQVENNDPLWKLVYETLHLTVNTLLVKPLNAFSG